MRLQYASQYAMDYAIAKVVGASQPDSTQLFLLEPILPPVTSFTDNMPAMAPLIRFLLGVTSKHAALYLVLFETVFSLHAPNRFPLLRAHSNTFPRLPTRCCRSHTFLISMIFYKNPFFNIYTTALFPLTV